MHHRIVIFGYYNLQYYFKIYLLFLTRVLMINLHLINKNSLEYFDYFKKRFLCYFINPELVKALFSKFKFLIIIKIHRQIHLSN